MSLTAILATAALCVAVRAAPPSSPHFFSATHRRHISPLDYYMDSPEMVNYYTLAQQKNVPAGRMERLETLEPDSEVELVPGVQPPQPPQQPPVAPNIPGLIPGQRVFIVHMPVPGYRPGTIGGYQPVYIVAAAPHGNYANGYQNTLLVDPSVQVVSPMSLRAAPDSANPPVLLSAPVGYNPVNIVYNNPKNYRGPISSPEVVQLSLVPAGPQPPAPAANLAKGAAPGSEPKRAGQESGSEESKESGEDVHHRAAGPQ